MDASLPSGQSRIVSFSTPWWVHERCTRVDSKPPNVVAEASDQAGAIAKVDKHVSPKDCFVWFKNSKEGWTPIPGTGCAHYVSHTLGMKGIKGVCAAGYSFRVPDLVRGLSSIKVDEVAVNDIWVNAGLTHTGLIVEIKDDVKNGRNFVIEHCSSQQGGVVRNEWKTHFSAKGRFYKLPSNTGTPVPEAKTTARRSDFSVREAFS